MSTVWLTVAVGVMLIVGLFLRAAAELYRHRSLVVVSLLAAAGFAALHLAFITIAWQAAATVAEEEPYPAVASLPTAVYDMPAWIALVLLVAAGIGCSARHIRERKWRLN